MKHLTIRNLPAEIAEALQERSRRSRKSLNQTVIELLAQALGMQERRSNGLARLAGTWSEEEFRRFQAAVEGTELVEEGGA